MPKKYQSKLTKDVAYKKLEGILFRIRSWNERYANYYVIDEAALIGSIATDGDRFGDIDLCIKIKRSKKFSHKECKYNYIKWREQILGFKPPESNSSAERGMFELDVSRYIKNRDGRIDLLPWNQFHPICLALRPYIKLVDNSLILVDSLTDIEKYRDTFSEEQAMEIIRNGTPEKPLDTNGIYWDSYCSALARYPSLIRNAVLERDSYVEAYSRCVNVQ
ncbi:MAG: hypothetical protein ACI9EK_002468 [Psychroserpens sp.]